MEELKNIGSGAVTILSIVFLLFSLFSVVLFVPYIILLILAWIYSRNGFAETTWGVTRYVANTVVRLVVFTIFGGVFLYADWFGLSMIGDVFNDFATFPMLIIALPLSAVMTILVLSLIPSVLGAGMFGAYNIISGLFASIRGEY